MDPRLELPCTKPRSLFLGPDCHEQQNLFHFGTIGCPFHGFGLIAIPFASISTSSFPYQPHMKLDVPHFNSQDALEWIFKISQFFDYQCVPDNERLTVASFNVEGPTLCWYQWMSKNGFLTSWPAMLQVLESRFALSYYDDPHGALFKL